MAEPVLWPCDVLVPAQREFNPAFRSIDGGVNLDGSAQTVESDAGVWRGSFRGIDVFGEDQVALWQAIQLQVGGRAGTLLVCTCGNGRPPFPDDYDPDVMLTAVPHSDLSPFSDGSLYETKIVSASLAVSAGYRATQIVVSKDVAGDLKPSNDFSIGNRLYRIRRVLDQTDAQATIEIWPPLREPAIAGTELEFDDPVLEVQLLSDTEMDLSLEELTGGVHEVNFIEAL